MQAYDYAKICKIKLLFTKMEQIDVFWVLEQCSLFKIWAIQKTNRNLDTSHSHYTLSQSACACVFNVKVAVRFLRVSAQNLQYINDYNSCIQTCEVTK